MERKDKDVLQGMTIPAASSKEFGGLNIAKEIREVLTECMIQGGGRDLVVKRLGHGVGMEIARSTLDAMTRQRTDPRLKLVRFPAEWLPAITQAAGPEFLKWIAAKSGCLVVTRQEAHFAEIGHLLTIEENAKRQRQALFEEEYGRHHGV
ncbi:MAG: hypothetical protein HQL64_12445 [Magnetococcales bacterium]|nr:hypothetical protein [Magnetococcales bacterium]